VQINLDESIEELFEKHFSELTLDELTISPIRGTLKKASSKPKSSALTISTVLAPWLKPKPTERSV